jgi:hypothetical protein
MADKKISALTASTTPLAGTEVLPIVQGGATVKVSVANLTAGRAVGASSFTASGDVATTGDQFFYSSNGGGVAAGHLYSGSTGKVQTWVGTNSVTETDGNNFKVLHGNVVISTSGNGIDFSATAGTGTSELLADYEEGTWTPTITAAIGSYTTVTDQAGTYTKIGRQVTLKWYFVVTNKGTGLGSVNISNLPFASNASAGNFYAGSGYDTSQGIAQITSMTATTSIDALKYDGTDPIIITRGQVGQITYFV